MLSKLPLEAYSQALFWSRPGYNVPNCPNHLILASLFEDILPSNILPDHNGCVKPFQICQSLLIWNNEKKKEPQYLPEILLSIHDVRHFVKSVYKHWSGKVKKIRLLWKDELQENYFTWWSLFHSRLKHNGHALQGIFSKTKAWAKGWDCTVSTLDVTLWRTRNE